MKYNEYKKIAEKFGWEMDNSYTDWLYADKPDVRVAIDKTRAEALDITIDYDHFNLFEEKEFIKACYELAETPIENRRDEKEYYLRHMFLCTGDNNHSYLNMHIANGWLFLSNKVSRGSGGVYKTRFTEREMKKIEDDGFDLWNFELVEVEDEN